MKKPVVLLMLLMFAIHLQAQDLSLYKKEYYITGMDTLPYRLLLPENFDPSKKYPLVLVLHGAGERGNDNEAQLMHGGRLFIQEDVRKNYPAIVVFPQCPASSFWSSVKFQQDSAGKRSFAFSAANPPTVAMKLVQDMLFKLLKEYKVKSNQVYVTGLSMGGMGTFEIVSRNQTLFAAAAPICGGGDPAIAPDVRKVKWWVFHGAADNVVPPVNSEIMVKALTDAGASVKFNMYPGVGHNSWDNAFAEKDFLPWMFSIRK